MSNLVSVQFNHQTLTATLVDGIPHVALKPICNQLDLDWAAQFSKIKRHPVLNSTVVMMTMVAEDGRTREMLMLPLTYLNGWLFGIDAKRVKPEAKEAVLMYQRECFNVLAAHFMPKQYGLKEIPPDMTLVKKSFINTLQDELAYFVQLQNQKIDETRLTHEQWLDWLRKNNLRIVSQDIDELREILFEQNLDFIDLNTHKPVAKSVLNVIQDLLVL